MPMSPTRSSLIQEANSAVRSGDLRLAETLATAAFRLPLGHDGLAESRLDQLLGLVLQSLSRDDDATLALARAVGLAESAGAREEADFARHLFAEFLIDRERWSEALAVLGAISSDSTNFPHATALAAGVLERVGRSNEARIAAQAAMEAATEDQRTHVAALLPSGLRSSRT